MLSAKNQKSNIYVSPFPRQNSNENVLRQSRPISVSNIKTENAVVYFEIPPTITKTYMNRNSMYFDIKNVKEKSSANKFFNPKPKSEKKFKPYKRNDLMNYTQIVIDKNKIENILNNNQNLLKPKPILSPQKDTFKAKVFTNNRVTSNEFSKLSSKIINDLLHEKKKSQFLHKSYGNVPEYINEFKFRQTLEKEYERLLQEEKNYPKGTIKISEEERVNILNKLNDKKDNLMTEISKFPVSSHLRSIKITNQKREIESKLKEVENAIKTFEKSRVFLKK